MATTTRRLVLALSLAAIVQWPAEARADMNTDWMATVEETLAKVRGFRADRARAIAWLAAFNALDAIEPRFRPYPPAPPPVATGGPAPSPEAAFATALYTALVVEPDADHALLAKRTRDALAGVKNSAEREAGAALGRRAALLLLMARSEDLLDRIEPAAREARAGEFVAAADAKMPRSLSVSRLAPFGVRSVAAVDPGPPPALGSETALREIAETRALGGAASTQRTSDQAAAALFWNSGEPADFIALIKPVLEARKLDTLAFSRIMALDAMMSIDSSIAGAALKEKYFRWRPDSAIAGPFAAEPKESSWQPLVSTPNSPEYPSGGGIGAGISEVELPRLFELRGPIEWRNGQTGQTRRWPDAAALAEELAAARVWGGVHFRSAVDAGRKVGRAVATEILEQQLRPR